MAIEVTSTTIDQEKAQAASQGQETLEMNAGAPAPKEEADKTQDTKEEVKDEEAQEDQTNESEETEDDQDPDEDQDAEESEEGDDEENDEDESGEEDEDDSEDLEKKKAKSKKPSAIQKLKYQRNQERLRNEQLEQRLYELEQRLQNPQPKEDSRMDDFEQRVQRAGRPDPNDFDNPQDYEDALVDWKVDQKLNEKEQETRAKKEQKAFLKEAKAFKEKIYEFADEVEDFDKVAANLYAFKPSREIQAILRKSDVPGPLIYELGQDPSRFEEILSMDPVEAARTIGRIEASLTQSETPSTDTPKKKPKTVTKAPKPVSTVGKHSKGGVKKSIYDPNLPFSEYERLRREQAAR